jgi:hypothetical protein
MDDQSKQRSTAPNEDETLGAGRGVDDTKQKQFAEDAALAFTLLFFIVRLAWEFVSEGGVLASLPEIIGASLITGLAWYGIIRWQVGHPSRFHRT